MNCIICNTETRNITYYGIRNGVKAAFCKEHKLECVNSDLCVFEAVVKELL